ncbi:MAG TPA: COX aromatic rich motif-containing protein [Candidatus Saccharimonadales bacterium]|nr:COX aromatic rich motif-containing protein [Candidatus Saccharimonadales bacterium]
MKKHIRIWLGVGAVAGIVAVTVWYLRRYSIPVLQPAGEIGAKERNLIVFCALISGVIVIPVFGMLGYVAWKYRESNKRAKYSPELEGSALAETIWWLVPTALLTVISVVNWRSSYALDPFKPLNSSQPTLHVQVVALDWKWLFIYPGQHVASVSQAAIPANTPVDFEITSDTVMSSFWAPQLGGQMYAMPGMSTELNLQADRVGDYRGVAANISGKGFAGMEFDIKAMSAQGFSDWIRAAKQSPAALTDGMYARLARPSTDNPPTYYASVAPGLYDTIVMKYMMPMGGNTNTTGLGV